MEDAKNHLNRKSFNLVLKSPMAGLYKTFACFAPDQVEHHLFVDHNEICHFGCPFDALYVITCPS